MARLAQAGIANNCIAGGVEWIGNMVVGNKKSVHNGCARKRSAGRDPCKSLVLQTLC